MPLWELPLSDWRWTIDVNLWGVIHGCKAFIPGMLAHGEEGHVVNTSSGNGGLIVLPFTPIYSTSKAAVSALTEVLHHQLAATKLHASVLYPGPNVVATNIFSASRNRSADYARGQDQIMPPITLDIFSCEARSSFCTASLTAAAIRSSSISLSSLLMIEGVKQTGTYFLTPTQLVERTASDPTFHDVGLKVSAKVVKGSIRRDPASQRPTAHMPKIQMAPGDADALAAYLSSLR